MEVKKYLQKLIGGQKRKDKSRILRANLTGVTTLIVKGMTITAGILTIPLTAQYLGVERYGMWLALSSLMTWAGLIDLGIGSSLTNILSTADGRQEHQKAQESVSSAFWILLALTSLIGFSLWIIFPLISWEQILNVRSVVAIEDINAAVTVTFVLVLCRVFLSLPGQIYGAYQEGYLYQLWGILGSASSIIALLTAISLKSNISILLLAFFGCTFLTDICAAIYLFGRHRKYLKPKFSSFKWSSVKTILKSGSQLWIVQISSIIMYQTDLVIITQLFGATAVVSYGIATKFFSLILMIQFAFTVPLWPAYSESLARGDINWIEKTFKTSIYFSFLWSAVISLLILSLLPAIITDWIGSQAVPDTLTLLALSFRTIVLAVDQCVGVLCNGLALLRIQAIVSPIFAISNLSLALVLGHIIGVSGIAWATGICTFFFSIPFFFMSKNILRQ